MSKTLTLVRHGKNTGELTKRGITETFNLAAQLREKVPALDAILHSPILRTTETGKIVGSAYEAVSVIPTENLRDDKKFSPDELSDEWDNVCLVSHSPVLYLLAYNIKPETLKVYQCEEGEALVLSLPIESWRELLGKGKEGTFEVLYGDTQTPVNPARASQIVGGTPFERRP